MSSEQARAEAWGAGEGASGSWGDSIGSAFENALRRVGMKTCARGEKPEVFTGLIHRRLTLLIRPASFRAQQRFPLSHRPLSTLCYSCLPSSRSPTLDLRTEVALGYTSLCILRALPSQQLLKPSRRPAALTPACLDFRVAYARSLLSTWS